jgi:hypothetical protein
LDEAVVAATLNRFAPVIHDEVEDAICLLLIAEWALLCWAATALLWGTRLPLQLID